MFLPKMFQIPQMFLPKMFQIPQMFGQTEEKYTDLWEAKLKILARKRTFSQKKKWEKVRFRAILRKV